jgi:hypothetical protein
VTWAAETIGHATSSTFPTGGPASAAGGPSAFGAHGGPRGAFGHGGFGRAGGSGFAPPGGAMPPGAPGAPGNTGTGNSGTGNSGLPGLFGARGSGTSASGGPGVAGGPGGFGAGGRPGFGAGGPGGFGGDSASLNAAIRYARAHGGGTIGVASQSSAAAAILSTDANMAGLGGFSGRESSVTAAWIAMEVRNKHLRWVITSSNTKGARIPGDTRQGSQAAMDVVARTCQKVSLSTSSSNNATASSSDNSTMYDCHGRASAILAAAKSS